MTPAAPRIGWMGFHLEGLPALRAVLAAGHELHCAFTLADEQLGRRSGPVDYGPVCAAHGVPLHRIRNVNDEEVVALLVAAELDFLFVIGWSQIVRPPALRAVRRGLIGAHASLLPHNRGSAPINWALINGETRGGNTLLWLSEGVDSGDVIDQREFAITPFDTCATLYDRVAESNRDMILALWPQLLAGALPRRPQPPSDEPILAQRRPRDGLLDWTLPAGRIYDQVRALTRPYPGAFTTLDGDTWFLWRAALPPAALTAPGAPGEVLGPLLSPEPAACGICVATGAGAILLLELQDGEGRTLAGRELAEGEWKGRRFTS